MYRPLLEIQKCTSIEKSQYLCGFPLLSGCTSMPRSCTLSLILVHLYNNENPSVYAGLRHCCTLSYSRPWGNGFCAVPRGGHTSPLFLEYGKAGPTGLACRLGRPLGNVPPGRSGPAPPLGPWDAGLTCRFGRRRAFATGKLRPTPCKFFEKNLTKNFYVSLPSLSAGFWASGPQPAPPPLAAFAT